jgi:EAL domain-containing protein (putative c-di-GMP-specific phosphodiesterase class I)
MPLPHNARVGLGEGRAADPSGERRTIDVLVGLRAISVRTALDDFGAGRPHSGT